MIIAPIAAASGITWLSEITKGKPFPAYLMIAMVFVIISLMLLENVNAQLATVFAWLILGGVVFARGPALLEKVGLI